jgi:hypothetical protein
MTSAPRHDLKLPQCGGDLGYRHLAAGLVMVTGVTVLLLTQREVLAS